METVDRYRKRRKMTGDAGVRRMTAEDDRSGGSFRKTAVRRTTIVFLAGGRRSCVSPVFNVVKLSPAPNDPITGRRRNPPPLELVDGEEEYIV